MSYNNSAYYKGVASGPTRGGRGGSFRSRGSNDGGGTWQARGRGRGNFSSGPQRGSSNSWYNKSSSNFNKSYNDRNSSNIRDNNDRFSNRGNESDYTHRYSRQGTADNYSARNDHGHHRTPEDPPRKRMRTDSYSGDSNRRGHDGSFDSYGSNRYDNYSSEKSNYGGGEDRVRAVYRDDRRPSINRREEFSQRPRETATTSMPPPSQSYRGTTYRGRGGVRGRGATRGGFTRRQDNFVSPRNRLADTFKAKKRLVVAKPDFFKSKLQKLRSFAVNRNTRKETRVRDVTDEENWNDEVIEKDAENGEEKVEKSPEKKKRPVKIVKKIIKKVIVKKDAEPAVETPAEPEEVEKKVEVKEPVKEVQEEEEVEQELEEGEEEEEVVEEEMEVEEEEELEEDVEGEPKSAKKVKVTIKRDSEGRAVSEDGKKTSESNAVLNRKSFIKLQCAHCRTRCLTFKDYHDHLRGSKHIFAMREVSLSMKQTLMRMRTEQRAKQRVIEEAEELQGISSTHTNFCPTCKLNYRQERERHITSEMHKKMKDYLMPFCSICHISFKSPMLYENHICSLEHIRAKESARKAELLKTAPEVEKDVDMDSLLILDSVGSADEEDSDEEIDTEGTPGKKKKSEINLGADYIRKVQVLYCDLCEMYLPRREELDDALVSHCRTRNHLQRYVRYRDDVRLRREAERIHRRDQAEQEARTKALKESESGGEKKEEAPEEEAEKEKTSEKAEEEAKATDKSVETKELNKEPETPNPKSADTPQNEGTDAPDSEDKMWADVDKGLDELLREVAPGCKSSDEDEDSGRYDRFKHSKAEEAAAKADAAGKKEAEAELKAPAVE